jgi:hypothetical protein
MKTDRVKTTLIALSAIAAALGVIAAVVVFYPTGSYQPVIIQGPGTTTSTTTSTASSTTHNVLPTSTASTGTATGTTGITASPIVTWNEGHGLFAITGGTLQGNQLTLTISIQGGDASSCAPSPVRYIADEAGTPKAPGAQTCTGAPGNASGAYTESLTFTASPAAAGTPLLFTTGGASNIFFETISTAGGGIQVQLPANSG